MTGASRGGSPKSRGVRTEHKGVRTERRGFSPGVTTSCLAFAIGIVLVTTLRAQTPVDRAFAAFFDAADPTAAAAAADAIVKSGMSVDDALARLRAGRTLVEKGAGAFSIKTSDGTVIENLVEAPAGYTPARRWPLRVQLHGGVSRPEPGAGQQARQLTPNRIQGEEAIYLQPRGHGGAEWWHLSQYENIVAAIDRVKRLYNVDENLVYMTGVSDGATGAYFYAMKLPTPFSAFLPLNGNMRVLATPGTRANGQMYAGNMVNKPLFVINGGRDPLYPVNALGPHIDMMRAAGGQVEFHPQPGAGHDTSWWPAERERFERFVREHPRTPHPEFVSWETERTDRYNRVHWLVVDRLGRRPGDDAGLVDVNRFAGDGGEQRMFARTWPSGRIDVRRTGNTFEVRSRGVAAFTLLLSPDVIDFTKPVVVRLHRTVGSEERHATSVVRSAGALAPASPVPASDQPASEPSVIFNSLVPQDLATLLRWSARDNDRTMLYTAELSLKVS
jgi:hypothetical protein